MKLFKTLLLIAFVAMLFHACHKQANESPEPPSIEGHWVNLNLTFPDWQYHFNDNILEQYIVEVDDTIGWHQFTYAVRNDTIIIGGDATAPNRVWKATFWADNITEINNITPGVLIAPILYLRKTQ